MRKNMRKCFKVVSVLLSALLLVGVLDSVSFADDEFLPQEQRVVKGSDMEFCGEGIPDFGEQTIEEFVENESSGETPVESIEEFSGEDAPVPTSAPAISVNNNTDNSPAYAPVPKAVKEEPVSAYATKLNKLYEKSKTHLTVQL